jgi:hypothetical protein
LPSSSFDLATCSSVAGSQHVKQWAIDISGPSSENGALAGNTSNGKSAVWLHVFLLLC